MLSDNFIHVASMNLSGHHEVFIYVWTQFYLDHGAVKL